MNPMVGVYIPIIRIPIKGGMTIPNIATFDHGTSADSVSFFLSPASNSNPHDLHLPLSRLPPLGFSSTSTWGFRVFSGAKSQIFQVKERKRWWHIITPLGRKNTAYILGIVLAF